MFLGLLQLQYLTSSSVTETSAADRRLLSLQAAMLGYCVGLLI